MWTNVFCFLFFLFSTRATAGFFCAESDEMHACVRAAYEYEYVPPPYEVTFLIFLFYDGTRRCSYTLYGLLYLSACAYELHLYLHAWYKD